MSLLLAEEAFLFSPSTPKLAAVKLHTSLQRFAWTEAEVGSPGCLRLLRSHSSTRSRCAARPHLATPSRPPGTQAPAVQQQRGLPGEPLFCFETAMRAIYYCMHTYRHFRASVR